MSIVHDILELKAYNWLNRKDYDPYFEIKLPIGITVDVYSDTRDREIAVECGNCPKERRKRLLDYLDELYLLPYGAEEPTEIVNDKLFPGEVKSKSFKTDNENTVKVMMDLDKEENKKAEIIKRKLAKKGIRISKKEVISEILNNIEPGKIIDRIKKDKAPKSI